MRPDYAEACNNLALVLRSQGKLDQAVARFKQAIALRPDYAEAYSNLGDILCRQSKLDEATVQLEQAIALAPGHAAAHNNLGNVLAIQEKFEQAIARFQRAIALDPGFAEAHNNLGSVLWKQEKVDEATVHVSRALALRPGYAEARNNLGNLLAMQNRFTEAAAQFQQALALRPDYVESHHNLGRALLAECKFDEAEVRLKHVLTLVPDHADAECSLASCYLVQGDFRRGWPAYEARLRLPGLPPTPQAPRWNGEPLAGRRLILVAEQGLGDTIHFLRFARMFKAQGAHVTLAVQPALVQLLASHPDLDGVVPLTKTMEYPPADFYVFLHSLPAVLDLDASTIPAEVPYLSADPELTEHWRQELAGIEGFKIGIVWQGSRGYTADRWRSMPLANFAPLARLPGVRLISLQKGYGSEQIKQVDFPVIDLAHRLDEATGPFVDTAAVIANLDLVVAANTAIAHLAGAMNVPVFLAINFSPDWRWLRDRDDSLWYPSARLFRQQTFGQWPDVFERIAQAVAERRAATA